MKHELEANACFVSGFYIFLIIKNDLINSKIKTLSKNKIKLRGGIDPVIQRGRDSHFRYKAGNSGYDRWPEFLKNWVEKKKRYNKKYVHLKHLRRQARKRDCGKLLARVLLKFTFSHDAIFL